MFIADVTEIVSGQMELAKIRKEALKTPLLILLFYMLSNLLK